MGRLLSYLAVFLMTYSFYVVFSGATSLFTLVLGSVGSLVVAVLVKNLLVSRKLKISDIRRLAYLVLYYAYYMTVAEVRAHVDIAKIVLSRKMKISPAIVKVPYYVETSYGMTLIAGSITNTPGTVVVQVDTNRKHFYVHWLTARVFEPARAREEISAVFENYSQKIFG
ncbi:MAG: Na+/H+ antiporter subunit E [Sulfolobales archaeon]|nr:Na+/H+ antiporter subunit E [Sulfolobales archaeon]MCX8209186.1 Na+/H+ antiporter subunit E [Sulfolobales archaeon]MDW8010046.1 Na+/H+ antiporter subunit E [Sulfolobales archaeon]